MVAELVKMTFNTNKDQIHQKSCKPQSISKSTAIAKFLQLIAEPNRLKILCILKQGPLCAGEIAKATNQPKNLVSHHLKALKQGGLLTCKQNRRFKIYSQNTALIKKLCKNLSNLLINKLYEKV